MVSIYSYTSGAKKLMGTVQCDENGQVHIDGKIPPAMASEIRATKLRVGGNSNELFYRALLETFTGSYVRAERG